MPQIADGLGRYMLALLNGKVEGIVCACDGIAQFFTDPVVSSKGEHHRFFASQLGRTLYILAGTNNQLISCLAGARSRPIQDATA